MTTFGNMATYSCDLGHELLPDNSIRICQANGTWSGMNPSCQGMKYAVHQSDARLFTRISCCTAPTKSFTLYSKMLELQIETEIQ